MADIRPFRAIRYTEKAGNLKDLITKPYDKIDPDLQREYYQRSPYNYCRLILPAESERYKIAKERIQKWTKDCILVKDKEPAFFISRQQFKISEQNYSRIGLISALRLYPYDESVVFPHEVTYKEPKADRLNILRAVEKDLEPVFLIFSDPDNTATDFFSGITLQPPLVDVEDTFGVRHSLWKVADPKQIDFIQKLMTEKILVITDGHHRYESAIAYRDEKRKNGEWTDDSAFNFHMCYLVPVQEEGLVVLPTHRLLKEVKLTEKILQSLEQFFRVEEIAPTAEAIDTFLHEHLEEHVFCVYDGSKSYGLTLKDEDIVREFENANCPEELYLLDVVILQEVVFKHIMKIGMLRMDEHIIYEASTKGAIAKVKNREASCAFLVNPIHPETVWNIAQKSLRLPEKSTDFYPKPVSGLMMMDISAEEKL